MTDLVRLKIKKPLFIMLWKRMLNYPVSLKAMIRYLFN